MLIVKDSNNPGILRFKDSLLDRDFGVPLGLNYLLI